MNNLAEVCLVGLGVGGNYIRCLVISMGLGGAKRCGGGFKVIILRETGEWGKPKRGTRLYGGELTPLYTMKGVLTM